MRSSGVGGPPAPLGVELFAKNRVRIFAIGKESIIWPEQGRRRAGGELQNSFESSADRRVAQPKKAVADDQESAGLEATLQIRDPVRKILEADEMVAPGHAGQPAG